MTHVPDYGKQAIEVSIKWFRGLSIGITQEHPTMESESDKQLELQEVDSLFFRASELWLQ